MTVAYDPPSARCLGPRDAPGTVALRDECLALFEGSYNLGTCACRNVGGTSTPSCHRECRAWDAGFRMPGSGQRNPLGDELAWFLVDQHDLLSVQVVIWNRRIWSVTRPYWRTYGGQSDHLDHVHVEQNWHGAKKCTRATVRLAFERWLGPLAQPEDPDMPKYRILLGRPQYEGHALIIMGNRLVHLYDPQTAADMGIEVVTDSGGRAVGVKGAEDVGPNADIWKRLPVEIYDETTNEMVLVPPL